MTIAPPVRIRLDGSLLDAGPEPCFQPGVAFRAGCAIAGDERATKLS
jgi:hypothetical protein